MKVLHVIPAYRPSEHYGGATGVVEELVRRQQETGHTPEILTTDALDADNRVAKDRAEVSGTEVRYVPNLSNRLAYQQKFFTPLFPARKTPSPIEGYDVIHLHDYRTLLNVSIAKRAQEADVPYIIQAHGALNRSEKALSKRFFDIVAGKGLLQRASACIALNETERLRYVEEGVDADRIEVIPNGISQQIAEDVPGSDGDYRASLGLDQDQSLVLYTGRLHRSKSVGLLLRAFADVAEANDDVHLAIVGPDDGEKARLESFTEELGLRDRVTFSGFVDSKLKWAAYRDADLVVIPSFFGFPLVTLEAWAAGTPVLLTNKHERLGFLDDQAGFEIDGSEQALAEKLLEVLADRGRLRKLGKQARDLVQTEFTWTEVNNQLETVYREVQPTR